MKLHSKPGFWWLIISGFVLYFGFRVAEQMWIRQVFGAPLPYSRVIAAVVLFISLLRRPTQGALVIHRRSIFIIGFYLAATFASTLLQSSNFPWDSFSVECGWVIVFLLVCSANPSTDNLQRSTILIFSGGGLVLLGSLYYTLLVGPDKIAAYLLNFSDELTHGYRNYYAAGIELRRLDFPFIDPNSLAYLLGSCALLGPYVARKFPSRRISVWLLVLLLWFGCVLTLSRGAIVSAMLVFIWLGIRQVIRREGLSKSVQRFAVLLGTGAMFLGFLDVVFPTYGIGLAYKLENLRPSAEDFSVGERRGAIALSLDAFAKCPVFGVGMGNITWTDMYASEDHNFYTKTLGEKGIVGFGLFVLFFWSLSAGRMKSRVISVEARARIDALSAALMFQVVGLMFAPPDALLWVVAALLASSVRMLRNNAARIPAIAGRRVSVGNKLLLITP